MTANNFASAATTRPQYLVKLREDRTRYGEAASDPRLCGCEREWYARYWWASTAAIAHYLAHDQGLADIAAAISSNHASLSDPETLCLAIARLAQAHDEAPVGAGDLRELHLLPTTCRLSQRDFCRLAGALYHALEQGSAEDAHEAMHNLIEFYTFTRLPSSDCLAPADTP